MGEVDRRADDRGVALADRDVADERPVQLELLDG